MSFDAMVERFKTDPRIIIEEVTPPNKWRSVLAKYDDESTVDEFILWAKQNKDIISAFVNKMLEHVKASEKVSAITITDEIKCNHNRSKLLAVVAMTMKAECRGYFNIRSKK